MNNEKKIKELTILEGDLDILSKDKQITRKYRKKYKRLKEAVRINILKHRIDDLKINYKRIMKVEI